MTPKPHEYLATELTIEALKVLETEQDAHRAARVLVADLTDVIRAQRAEKRRLMVYCYAYMLVATVVAVWGWIR